MGTSQPIVDIEENGENPYTHSPIDDSDQQTNTANEDRPTPSRAALALADQLVVSGSNFLTMAIVARSCPVAAVGLFHLAWTLVNFMRTANERTLAAPYFTFVHRDDQDSRTLLGSSLVHQAFFAVLCSILLVAFAIVATGSAKLAALAPIVGFLVVTIPFMLLRDHIRAVSAAHFQYHVALVVDVIASILQVAGIVALALSGSITIPRVVLVLGVACLIPSAGWLIIRPREFSIQRETVIRDWRQNWCYAKWLVLSRSIAIGANNLIPFLVLYLMNPVSAGGFGVATALVGLSLTFIMGANNFFQPRTIKAYHQEGVDRMMQTIYETILVMGSILLLIVLLFSFAGGWLLSTIYGPAYAIYGPVTAVLSAGMLVITVSIACSNGLAALGRSKEYFAGEVSYCILSLAGALLLIPIWGLLGAATALLIGSVAASGITACILWSLVQRERANNLTTPSGSR